MISQHIPQIKEASQIKLSSEKIMNKLAHIKQFNMKCEKRGKLEFIKEVFEVCEKTQTFIFVNTKDFAETVDRLLKKGGYASYILFGKMTKEERDSTMQKFREERINVLITTDILSRGIDIPEA
jgi:superfamily II DNA/RNA helicase